MHSASDADAVTPSTAVLLYTRSYKRRSVPSSPIRSFLASTGALVVMMPQDCPGGSSLFEFLSIYANIMTYWPAGGGRGQNPENTAQGHSGHNSICP